jgi:hypothetical protein
MVDGVRYLGLCSFWHRNTFSKETARNLSLISASSRAKGGPARRVIRSRAASLSDSGPSSRA